MKKEIIQDIYKLSVKHDVVLFTDEIYEHYIFDDNSHYSINSDYPEKNNVISIYSLSKGYGLTGIRVGYIVSNENMIASIAPFHHAMNICAPVNAQYASIEALNHSRLWFDDEMKNLKNLMKLIKNIYKEHTKVPQKKIDEIPMMNGITKFKDFAFLFSVSSGYPGTIEWVQYAADPTGVPMSSGVTSIQVNEVMPYVQSGQMVGLLAGMPGAAEYESLIGEKGSATSGMDAQSIAHLVIVLFIVLGNTAYFIERKRSKKY